MAHKDNRLGRSLGTHGTPPEYLMPTSPDQGQDPEAAKAEA